MAGQQAAVSASNEVMSVGGLQRHREEGSMVGSVGRMELSMPRGSPVSYGPTPQREQQNPLFDYEQLRRLQELQGQAPWLYGQFGAGETPLPRPRFLPGASMDGNLLREEVNVIKSRINTLEAENETTRDMNRRLAEENARLKKSIEEAREQLEAHQKFVTPDKGSAGSGRGSVRSHPIEVDEVTDPKEVPEDPYVTEETFVPKNVDGDTKQDGGGAGTTSGTSSEQATLQLMAKMMEGMTNLQRQILESKDKEGDAETVRGQQELPALKEWTATSGPVDLSDWLVMIEPLLADMSSSSAKWWKVLTKEAEEWYNDHLKLPPIDRVSHEASPSEELNQPRWTRLERRVSSMLLMAALQGLRKWFRWRHRATDLSVQEPDPFLLLKGLNRITKKVLDTHKDLSFRVSLARSTLQVDSTPTSRSISLFGRHLMAELEQVAHQDNNGSGARRQPGNPPPVNDKLKVIRAKKFEEENNKAKEDEPATKEQKCRFFLTKEGCRRGKSCSYSHDLKDELRRCFLCGCPDHLASSCPRNKREGRYSRSPPKAARVDATEDGDKGDGQGGQDASSAHSEKGEPTPSVQGLLEEATKVLKSISTATPSVRKEGPTQGSQRDEMIKNLQLQLDQLRDSTPSMKVMRLSRLVKNDSGGLLDSGATHPLRPRRDDEDESQLRSVEVVLADGAKRQLQMTPGQTMLSDCLEVEPIVPMTLLTTVLNCNVKWEGHQVQVEHPVRGSLKVAFSNGCPTGSRKLALDLIKEIEMKRGGAQLKELNYKEEEDWLKRLVGSHPVLSQLPSHIKEKLVGRVGLWNDLPTNKRQRKKFMKHGVIVHLFAGPDEGLTLKKAMQEQGGPIDRLLELDILRSNNHDVLSEEIYGGLLRGCFEGKLEASVGGPNCRTRSILRHFPIAGQTDYPRPVRSWKDGQQYGLHDLTDEERLKVQNDDIMMWRMITLFIVASYVRRAAGISKKVGFAMEQPASSKDQVPECVSIWDQPDWKRIKEEFDLEELKLNQGDYGGLAKKPTTIANNLEIQLGRPWRNRSTKYPPVKDSKQLSRWAPGLMGMVAEALKGWCEEGPKNLRALSWRDHVSHHHIPFRKDCVVCQSTQQRQLPHRRGLHPRCGVLSLDSTGPFHVAPDREGKGKYILVGALTWMVPRQSTLCDDAQQAVEVPGEALEIELEAEEDDEEKDGVGEAVGKGISSEALGNAEEAPRDFRLSEPNQLRVEEGGEAEGEVSSKAQDQLLEEEDEGKEDFEVRTYRMALPMSSKASMEVTRTAMELILRAKADASMLDTFIRIKVWSSLGTFTSGWCQGGSFILEPLVMIQEQMEEQRKLQQPPEEDHWMALELEVADAFKVRRRIRGKTAVRGLQYEEDSEERDESSSYGVARAMKVVQEEMGHLIHDDFEVAVEELKVLAEIKKLALEPQVSDEVLQTKIISPKEVRDNWKEWISPSKAEVESLLEEKAALRPVSKEELEKIKGRCEAQGRNVELVPSKIVFTRKPAPPPLGYKNKVRWVVCGNYESKKEGEENYSGGADAAAFRCLVHQASQHQWSGASIDIKTANAEVKPSESEDVILVKPPAFFVERNMMSKDVVFQPLRAVYGFRKSPRLWSQHRDDKFQKMEVEATIESKKVKLRFTPLDSEPNLWKIHRAGDGDQEMKALGLMMTYVDDIFTVGPRGLVEAVIAKIQSTWASTPPDWVGLKPLRFLGMEVSTFKDENQWDVWHVSQKSYIQDLVGHDAGLKPKVVPITRDQCVPSVPEEPPTIEQIRSAQKEVGELLWTVTRTRPDLMHTVAKMSALVTKDPLKVIEISAQAKGYLKNTAAEGLNFRKSTTGETLCAFSDASYAPDGECSHGCTIISYQGSTMMWKSGRQSVVSLSTAESELLEIIEALTAGESLFVMLNELEEGILKVAWCDSQAAVSILSCEGGSWRTRHLRIRASFARDIVQRGEWALHHMGGLEMIADIGTKPLTSSRLRFLKKLMNLEEIKNDQVPEENIEIEEKSGIVKEGVAVDLEKISKAVKVITLLAVLGTAEAEGEEVKEKEDEEEGLFLFLCVYTIAVILVMNLGRMIAWFVWEATSRIYKKVNGHFPKQEEEEKSERSPAEMMELQQVEKSKGNRLEVTRESSTAGSSTDGATSVTKPMATSAISEALEIFTTKTGVVYHTDRKCQYLKRAHTGEFRSSRFCHLCRKAKKEEPLRGDTLKIGDWGSSYHHVKFEMCLVCKEKGGIKTPTKR
eukprot:symbB.v1.2.025873.t1/scaffold2543.1/size76562/5